MHNTIVFRSLLFLMYTHPLSQSQSRRQRTKDGSPGGVLVPDVEQARINLYFLLI